MEIAIALVAIYLIFKLNGVLTVAIKMVNKSADLADESIEVYANDVRINLADKKGDQLVELEEMEYIPSSQQITDLLEGKTSKPEPKRRPRTTKAS